MIAIDTNVLVRFLTNDDPDQARQARAKIERADIFVATTVVLETEWVLRSVYGLDRGRIAEALTEFAGLSRVTLEEPAKIAQALQWTVQGMDFADALHLAAANGCEAFVTFDRRLAAVAGDKTATPIQEP